MKPQAKALFGRMRTLRNTNKEIKLIHGGAEGGDEVADSYAVLLEFDDIEIYPCHSKRYLFWAEKSDGRIREIHHVRKPLERNRIIAYKAEELIATPGTMAEELRSGTWATIRYARERVRFITIVFPDGSIKQENF